MNDIVQRLRTLEGWNTTGPKSLMLEAADEIERLRKERDELYEMGLAQAMTIAKVGADKTGEGS